MTWRLRIVCFLIIGFFAGFSVYYFKYYVAPKPRGLILFIVPGLNLDILNEASMDESGTISLPSLCENTNVSLVSNQTEPGYCNPAALISYLATGTLGLHDQIGLSPAGRRLDNLLYEAQRSGRNVGIVTTGIITDPLLAAFYAHQPNTSDRLSLARQVFDSTFINVILGATSGEYQQISAGDTKRDFIKEANDKGYRVVESALDLNDIPAWRTRYLLGLFNWPKPAVEVTPETPLTTQEIPSADAQSPARALPSLPEMVQRAVECLQYNIKLQGYFLVVLHSIGDTDNTITSREQAVEKIRELNHTIRELKEEVGPKTVIALYVPYEMPVRPPSTGKHPAPPLPDNSRLRAGFGWVSIYSKSDDIKAPEGFITAGELYQFLRSTF